MGVKREECEKVLGKEQYQEIFQFFRSKLNSDTDLNEEDQNEIDQIVADKLDETRNPQVLYTLYKILHLEVEVDNCKDKAEALRSNIGQVGQQIMAQR